ncbi:antiviral reverse transcriptase Drt3b [Undibacterium sp. TC9W]|uniref:antiviral reverse transcriptase Drt3b n=1 Tax=Undibacterium sp. TC9W TaxID=3413053 RepID=UPI003BF2A63D
MRNKKTAIKVDKTDYCRVLITETLPQETPVIFSNEGFYQRVKSQPGANEPVLKLIIDSLIENQENKYTIPFLYKIRKNALGYRRLALLHPTSQWRIKSFYEKYEKLICYYCSRSKASIRAPHRIASSFFYRNPLGNLNQYKYGSVHAASTDLVFRHSSSFFAYQGHERLYKFFNSNDFITLEKRYSSLWSIDVAKCFDSIYTHTMAWATKEKVFVKNNLFKGMSETFGQEFDKLMQKCNYNETNGIVIGPEVSRIFAEIICQQIDVSVCTKLESENLKLGADYEIRRYVDDIYIFTLAEETSKRIFEIYSEELLKFNLHVHETKTIKYERPFFTKKSHVIRDVNSVINEFFNKFLSDENGSNSLKPKDVWRQDNLKRSFIDAVKSVCISNQVTYDDVSSYIISAFLERIKRITNVTKIDDKDLSKYKTVCLIFLEVVFFFYSAAPAVSSSYKLCASIILVNRFAEMYLGEYEHTVKQRTFELGIELFFEGLPKKRTKVENFVHLESVNVLLAISELGDDYLLPVNTIEKMFELNEDCSYFDIITCLFYIKNRPIYATVKRALTVLIDKKLTRISGTSTQAEQACLFLDAISCPFLSKSKRIAWVTKFCRNFGGNSIPSTSDIHNFITTAVLNYWFVNWEEIDLLNSLQRKELKRVY